MMTADFRRPRPPVTRADLLAEALDDRNAALLDAIITAAAVVAIADGRVVPAERIDLLTYLRQQGLSALATREDILARFDARIEELQASGTAALLDTDLGALAGTSVARLVLKAGERIARADLTVSSDEEAVMQSIASALGRDNAPPAHP